MKRHFPFVAIAALALMAATWQNIGTLHSASDTVQQRCDQNQSQAVIEIPATTAPGPNVTSSPGPFGGQIIFETATNNIALNPPSPNPYGSPLVVTPANSSTYTNSVSAIPTSGPELKYYLTLGADQWVQARLASPDPNKGTATVKITCTGAVAFRGGGGSGTQATPSPSATSTTTAGPPSFTVSGSFPYNYAVNFPAAGSGGGSSLASFLEATSPAPVNCWLLQETSGTTMHDSCGTANGTYGVDVSDQSLFLPGAPCGMPGVTDTCMTMWYGSTDQGEAVVSSLPSESSYTLIFVVKDCDSWFGGGGLTNTVPHYMVSTLDADSGSNNKGAGLKVSIPSSGPGVALELGVATGNGSAISGSNFNQAWAISCTTPMLVWMYVDAGNDSNKGLTLAINGIPPYGPDGATIATSTSLSINTIDIGGTGCDGCAYGDVFRYPGLLPFATYLQAVTLAKL